MNNITDPEMRHQTTKSTYIQVANLHLHGINEGFLSTLGVDVLSIIYESIDADPYSVLIIEMRGNDVVGFVAAGKGMNYVYKQLILRLPRLFFALLPSLMNPAKLLRIIELLSHGSNVRIDKNTNTSELYSIAVVQHERRSGVALRLYAKLIEYFRQQDEESFYIIVGDNLQAAHRFYLRMGAVPLHKIEVHKGCISTVYRQEVI
jgi:ribosomal protein S18 acetylase RimI-like enzyme